MSTARTCPKCGALVQSETLEGMCQACLGKLVLDGFGGSVARGVATASVLFGDYELIEEIAHGGMGVVYKARQVSLNRTVAVKMIRAGQSASKEFVHRFRVEASAGAVLQHPNIVAVHEVGVHEGQHFFSMDYVAGRNLAQIVREGPLPPSRATRYVQKIAEAIHYAHQSGILHRDLKPSNVLIDQNDQPRITDFGLAKQLNIESSATLTGEVMGTPGYMPPEQASGNRGAVKAWSDVYSLGAVLYHLLTGRAPFAAGSSEETLQQVLHQDPVSIRLLNPAVARDLDTICLKCLAKEPGRRYASAQALSDELARYIRGEPIQARPVSRPEKVWRWCKRKPMAATALGLVIVVAVGSPIATMRIYSALKEARIEQGKAWLERSQSYLEEKNPFYAKLMAGRAIGFRGFGREKLTSAQKNVFLELLPPGSAESREAELILRGTDDFAPIWHGPPANNQDGRTDALVFSPDGRLLASGNGSTNIHLWEMATGKAKATLRGHSSRIMSVVFSPDGRLLASASDDRTIRLWDVPAQRSIARLEGYSGEVQTLAFSPDGALLGACGGNRTMRFWELPGARALPVVVKDSIADNWYWSLAFSPDGAVLAVGCIDGTVELWDVPTFQFQKNCKGHSQAVTSLAFSADGRWLASGSLDAMVVLWKMPGGERLRELQGQTAIASVQFSPDGGLLASENNIGVVRIWAVPHGGLKSNFRPSMTRAITGAADFSPDGSLLAAGGSMIQLWDLGSGQLETALTGHSAIVREAAISREGRTLASGSDDRTVALWNLANGYSGPELLKHPDWVRAVALSQDNRWLASGCADGVVRLWSVATARLEAELASHRGPVRALEFSWDGTLLASGGREDGGGVRLWNLGESKDYSLLREFNDGEAAFDLTFHPRNSLLAAATITGVKIWDAATGKTRVPPLTPAAWFYSVKFSPDGRLLAGGEGWGQGFIDLWEVDSGQLKARWKAHNDEVRGLDFSPDGNLLASASADHTIAVWEFAKTKLLLRLRGHSAVVCGVIFTPDGRRLISWGEDTSIRIWDLAAAMTRPLDYGSYMDWLELEGRNVTWRVFNSDADRPAPKEMPLKPFSGKSLAALLQSGLLDEELDRALFRRFLHAGNLRSARLLVERHEEQNWAKESQMLGRAYLQEAKAALDHEAYRLAVQHSARARTLIPESAAEAWRFNALAERGLKRWPESLAAIEMAIGLEKNNPDFWHDKALLLEQQNYKPAAREALIRAIELARKADQKGPRLESWRQHLEQLGP